MTSVYLTNAIILQDPHQAVERLSAGQVVAIPTETVYGLAGLGYDESVVSRIYDLKNRPKHNPLILHYACLDDTHNDVIWTPWAQYLANAFWPGPLTIVLSLTPHSRIPLAATGGLNSAAIRVPAHPMIQNILRQLNGPLAAPSANPSGQLSPTTAEHVAMSLSVPILDGGPCQYGVESTIIDGRTPPPKILRPGALSIADIMTSLEQYHHGNPRYWDQAIGSECLTQSKTILNNPVLRNASPLDDILCPGQLTAHYAPRKPLRLEATSIESGEGLLAFGPPLLGTTHQFQLSINRNLNEAANRLFAGLHYLDQSPCTRIAVMPIPTDGIGCAIADRLSRACAAFQTMY